MPIDDIRLVCTKNIFKHRTQHNKQAILFPHQWSYQTDKNGKRGQLTMLKLESL